MEPNPDPNSSQEKKNIPKTLEELQNLLHSLGFNDEDIEVESSFGNLSLEKKQETIKNVYDFFDGLDNKQREALKYLADQGIGLKLNDNYEKVLKDFRIDIKSTMGDEELPPAPENHPMNETIESIAPTQIPESEKTPEEPIPAAQTGEISKIPVGESIPSETRVIDVVPVPEKPLETNQEQPLTQEPQPAVPSPEPAPVVQAEDVPKIQPKPEKLPHEEFVEFERLRNDLAKIEAQKNNFSVNSGIGIEELRAKYIRGKERMATLIRQNEQAKLGLDGSPLTEEQKSKINDTIFEELVKKENDAYINALRKARGETSTDKILEKAKNILSNKAVKWYLGLSRTQRMAVSFGIGGVAGLAFGAVAAPGAIGVASYLAWRAARVGISGIAGAVAGEWANKKWSAEELKKAEEKETEDLKNADISLEEKSNGFKDIQQRYKKERIKITLKKMGTTVAAGAGAGLLTGLAEHAVMGMGGATKSALETKGGKLGSIEEHRLSPRKGFEPPPTKPQTGPVAPIEPIPPPKVSVATEPIAPKVAVPSEPSETLASPVEKIISDQALLKHDVVAGDSTWKILEKTLDHNDQFKGMTEAQKTYVLSIMTNKALQHPENYGLGHEGAIHIGDKTDFSKLFENTKEVKSILDKAQETISPGSAQENSISTNNAKIADWVKENPDVKITNDKVAEILATKPKVETIPEPIVPEVPVEAVPPGSTPLETPTPEVQETPVEVVPTEPIHHPDTSTDNPAPEPIAEHSIYESSAEDILQRKQLENEVAEAKQRLQTLETNKGGLRTMAGDVYEHSDVKAALTNEVNRFYDKHNFLGFGTVGGINTSEWRFMSKLPANKILEYYTHDATKSGLSAKVIEELSKSPKHDAFIKQVVGLMEQSNGVVKPFENENVEQFVGRIGGFLLKNTPKTRIIK